MTIACWVTLFLVFLTLSIQPRCNTTGKFLLVELEDKNSMERPKYGGKKDKEENDNCI